MRLHTSVLGLVLACILAARASAEPPLAALGSLAKVPAARDAIARVTYAEAAGQGDVGLAGVVFTILNRLASGRWGDSIEAVINSPGQFEPVLRAGGDWRALAPSTPAQRARIDTILNLAIDGRLPDPTGGALYFQNAAVVAARARAGTVGPELVHFGGATPSAVIGDHSFYLATGNGGPQRPADSSVHPGQASGPGERGLFVLPSGEIVEDAAGRQEP